MWYRCLFFILCQLLVPLGCFAEVRASLPDIQPGQSLTFRYRVRVNPSNTLPSNPTVVTNQGVVRADQLSDQLTDDPAVAGSTNPTSLLVVIRDTDGDGVADDLDQCPTSAIKTSPGDCGCDVVDADSNENGIADCLLNSDVLEQLERALSLVNSLKPNSKLKNKKKRKAQNLNKKALRVLSKSLNTFLINSIDAFVLADVSINLTLLNKKAYKAIKGSLKTGSKKFAKKRKLARKTIGSLQDALQ